MIGRYWSFMTPEYIYNEMTKAEVADSIDYVTRYEAGQKHHAVGPYKKGKKLWAWLKRESPDVDKQFRALFRKMKSDGVK